MKKLLLSLILYIPMMSLSAEVVEVNGINFILDMYNRTAKVNAKTKTLGESEYKGNIIIPENILYDGISYSVTSIGPSSFRGADKVTSINLPSSLREIGDWAFYGCDGITQITIPDSVATIGNKAFYYCTSLQDIHFPSGLKEIGEEAFTECKSLSSVIIPDEINSIGESAFYRCTRLGWIYLGSGLKTIGQYAFRDCISLENIFCAAKAVPETGSWAFTTTEGTYEDQITLHVRPGARLSYNSTKPWSNFFAVVGNLYAVLYYIDDKLYKEVPNPSIWSIFRSSAPKPQEKEGYTFSGWDWSEAPSNDIMPNHDVVVRGYYIKNKQPQSLALTELPTMRYGDAKYELPSVTMEGGELSWQSSNTAVATVEGNIMTIRGAGSTILTSTQDGSDEYKPFTRDFTLTVEKASLTISAQSCFKLEGEENPELVVLYEGFVNGDDETSLNQHPSIATTATEDSPIGTYPITVDGAVSDNYEITYVAGTLTVTINLTPTDVSKMDNVIYIEKAEARTGSSIILPIQMKNTAPIRGFQFNIYLPEGVNPATGKSGKIQASLNPARREEDDEHTLTSSIQPDGSILFLCGSQYDENFIGNDGTILTITLDIAEDMEDDDYPIVLKNIKLTETNINKSYEVAEVKSILSIYSYTLGDINNDGRVDVSDYIGIANRILGNTPSGFNEKAGDVNADGVIDVSDYIGVANLILYGAIEGR